MVNDTHYLREDAEYVSAPVADPSTGQDRDESDLLPLREVERRHIARVLAATGGRLRKAAQILGVTRWALSRRLRKYGLAVAEPEETN